MTKYVIIGDTHGDLSFATAVSRAAAGIDGGIKTLIQCGDFGIWDHVPDGVFFLDELNKDLVERDQRLVFVPGNHENFDSLERHEKDTAYTKTDEGFVPVRSNILYTGKVNTWTWDGVSFAAAGGAVSIDKQWRTPGYSWWSQEQFTYSELLQLAKIVNPPVDVLLTHDSPTSLPIWPGFIKDDVASEAHRRTMDDVWETTRPIWWFHGHYHRWLQYKHNGTHVTGLNCNPYDGPRKNNWVLFDPSTGQIIPDPWHLVK